MDIKQLKINGVAFYPKVPVEAIVSVDGDTGAVDTTVQPNSDNLVTSGAVYTAIQGKSTTWTDVQGKPNFATVATSGSYNDLTDKPTIPSAMSVDDALNANSTNPVQNKVVNGAIGGLQQSISGVSSQLNNKLSSGDLKTVNGQSLVGSGDITITPGSDVTVDDALNTSSTNPVQNKIVAGEIANLQYQITETADDLFNYYYTKTSTDDLLAAKQASLISGTNIKTINNQSILGSGDITISSGGSIAVDSALSTTSTNPVQNKIITNELYDVAEDVQELFGAVYNSGNNRIDTLESNKQDKLVSGTNIKTINGQTILGNGDITISGGGSTITVDDALNADSVNPVQNRVVNGAISGLQQSIGSKQDKFNSDSVIGTINGQSLKYGGSITLSTGEGETTYIENPYDITTALGYTTSGTNYAVQIASGKLYVNVPTSTGGISLVKSITLDDNGSALLAGEGSIYLQGLDGIKTKFNNNVISLYLEDQFKVDMQSALETAAQSLNDVGDLEERVAALEAIEPGEGGTSPSVYLKSITKSGNTYTIKDQANTETSWTIPGNITIDSELNTSSANPVENQVVAGEIANLQYQITETADDLSNFYYTKTSTDELLNAKLNTLVSGTNIKTVNNQSILGEGNITISGGGSTTLAGLTDVSVTGASAGKVLKYDGTTWVAANDNTSEGGSDSWTLVADNKNQNNEYRPTPDDGDVYLYGATQRKDDTNTKRYVETTVGDYNATVYIDLTKSTRDAIDSIPSTYVKSVAKSGNTYTFTDQANATTSLTVSKPAVKTFDIDTTKLQSYTVNGETKFKYFCLEFPITQSGSNYLFDCKNPVKVDVLYFDTNYDRTDTAFASFVLNADFVFTSSTHYGWKNVYNVYNDGAKYISAGANIAGSNSIVTYINPAPDVYEWIISRDYNGNPCILFPIGINKPFDNTIVQLKVTVSGLPSDGQGDVTVHYGSPTPYDDVNVSLASVNNEIQ